MSNMFALIKHVDDLLDEGAALGVTETESVGFVGSDGQEASMPLLRTLQTRAALAGEMHHKRDAEMRAHLEKYTQLRALLRVLPTNSRLFS